MKRILFGLFGLVLVACTSSHRNVGVPPGDGPLIGVYKIAIDDGGGTVRKLRLSVWAEAPNRLHAELIAPIGGVAFIFDAGGGQVCVVDVQHAVAYVGRDAPETLGTLLGVRLAASDAVAALLHGTVPEGLALTRRGSDGTLPESLDVVDGARSIALSRIRYERAPGGRDLGTGVPPPRLRSLPIEQLAP